ncbi:hypothetical protein XAXN_11245, partial [Xanthomonas axonopodis]
MKTHATNPNAFRTNSPYALEEKPRLTEDQSAASTSGTHQPLGRPPTKRRRIESDDPGASTRHKKPLTASTVKKEQTDASEGAWDRRSLHWQSSAVKNERIKTERHLDGVAADVGASSSHHRPQRSSQHSLEARASLRPLEQLSERSARKRPREEQAPSRQSKRPLHGVGRTRDDLRKAEHQLDRAEQKRLQAQRQHQQRQLSEPHGIARNHNAGLCVSMAYDNELAHRMRGGMALPFLKEGIAAQLNAQWLDKYLQLIATARRARAGMTPRDLDRCTELAAHYLTETGWFEGASLTQLAHVGNKLSKHPYLPACMEAIAWIAGEVTQADDLVGLGGYASVLLLNAFSKNLDSGRCERAVARLARYLRRDDHARQSLQAQQISLALNAFSKWPDNPDCQAMAHRFAALVASDKRLRSDMDAQSVATALNALCKWPDTRVCGEAASALAERLVDEPRLRQDLKSQELANSLNALSKWPDDAVCAEAASALAERLVDDPGLRKFLEPINVSQALNALSKWPGTEVCAKAASALAERLADNPWLCKALDPHHVATALNALDKWPNEEVCAAAVSALAERLADESRLRKVLKPQEVTNALNALCKWPGTPNCAKAASVLAERLADDPGLRKALSPQELTNALDALSKWPETAVCGAAVGELSARLADDSELRRDLNSLDVATALNALSKWPGTPACETAIDRLAAKLANEPGLREAMDAQGVAIALNALSRCLARPVCRSAFVLLAERAGSAELPWRQFEMRGIAMVANAMSRLLHLDDEDDEQFRTLGVAKLQAMAGHLDLHRELFGSASAADIGVLFKALASARLQRQMRPLGQPALQRLAVLIGDEGLRQTSLEGIGSLCMGLLPLIRSPELRPRHRVQALRVFNTLQPIVA